MSAPHEAVILVSEDVTRDRRVLASIAEYDCPRVIQTSVVARANASVRWRIFLRAAWVMVSSIGRAPHLRYQLRDEWGLRFNHMTAGFLASWRTFVRAQTAAESLRAKFTGVRTIHAHDLLCGIVGARLAKSVGARLVYDAHEVEFHRNRRNSLLRTAFDVGAERAVIAAAHEVRVVNAPIAVLYQGLYRIPRERLRVVLNNHFGERDPAIDSSKTASLSPMIVYVGEGTRGRQLSRLAREARLLNVPVHAFFLGDVPEESVTGAWAIGPPEYERELLALTSSYRCAMWCCVDDVCLSYRLALPNKFFQALAVGIPVIAASGTYLAELVGAYQLGFAFDGDNFQEIVDSMRDQRFVDLVRNIYLFRQALSAGQLRI